MTRETKIGLVVAGSFLCLVGIVVASKWKRGDAPSTDGEEQSGPKVAAIKIEPSPEKKPAEAPRPIDQGPAFPAMPTAPTKKDGPPALPLNSIVPPLQPNNNPGGFEIPPVPVQVDLQVPNPNLPKKDAVVVVPFEVTPPKKNDNGFSFPPLPAPQNAGQFDGFPKLPEQKKDNDIPIVSVQIPQKKVEVTVPPLTDKPFSFPPLNPPKEATPAFPQLSKDGIPPLKDGAPSFPQLPKDGVPSFPELPKKGTLSFPPLKENPTIEKKFDMIPTPPPIATPIDNVPPLEKKAFVPPPPTLSFPKEVPQKSPIERVGVQPNGDPFKIPVIPANPVETPSVPPIIVGAKTPLVQRYDPELTDVKPGETSFASISQRVYGSDKYGDALLAYNRDNHKLLPNGQVFLANPVQLPTGQRLLYPPRELLERDYRTLIRASATVPMIPAPAPLTPTPPPAVRLTPPTNLSPGVANVSSPPLNIPGSYTVQEPGGERIRDIARRFLGNADRWTEIYRLNPSTRPELPIPTGTSLKLPTN